MIIQKNDLDDKEFSLQAKAIYTITREYDDNKKRSFFFKDYAPQAFSNIRRLLGVSPKSFLKSWPMPSEDSGLAESTARSGSMFYTTGDQRYLFKTILHPEVTVMMALLRDYHQHLITYPRSFMVKIYGLFRYMYGTSKIWILIMGHTFPPTIPVKEKYDLKGRKPKPGKSISERHPRIGAILKNAPQKDIEFIRKIRFVEEHKQFYVTQLSHDIELLKSHDIMDYSLYIGIHEITEEELLEAIQIAAIDEDYLNRLPEEVKDSIQRHEAFIKIKTQREKKKKTPSEKRRSSVSKSQSPERIERKIRKTIDLELQTKAVKIKEEKSLKLGSDNGRKKKKYQTIRKLK